MKFLNKELSRTQQYRYDLRNKYKNKEIKETKDQAKIAHLNKFLMQELNVDNFGEKMYGIFIILNNEICGLRYSIEDTFDHGDLNEIRERYNIIFDEIKEFYPEYNLNENSNYNDFIYGKVIYLSREDKYVVIYDGVEYLSKPIKNQIIEFFNLQGINIAWNEDTIENKILLNLRSRFVRNNDASKLYDFNDHIPNKIYTNKLSYYCKEYNLNLFTPLNNHLNSFLNTQGNELTETKYGTIHMAALRSSSALLVNTLGTDETVKIKENSIIPSGEYYLEYEKTLNALKNADASVDALLIKDETVILIENKMLEYLNDPDTLNKSYLNIKKYNLPEEVASSFVELFKNFISNEITSKGYKINEEYGCYNIVQLLRHILGFITEYYKKNYQGIKKVVLINSVWNIPDDVQFYLSDHKLEYKTKWENILKSASKFKEEIEKSVNEIYKQVNSEIDFEFQFLSWHDFKNMIDMSDERKEYLKRYQF